MAKKTTQNKASRIRCRFDRTGKLRVETHLRDPQSITAAMSLNRRSHAARLYIDLPQEQMSLRFSGREARTLFNVLSNFYRAKELLATPREDLRFAEDE